MTGESKTPGLAARGFSFDLAMNDGALELRARHHPEYGAIKADWCGPELKRRISGGRKQLLARAVGLARKPGLSVLDATGGLGRDAYTLASLGAHVTLCERQPLVAALLKDAHRRATELSEHGAAAGRLELIDGDARDILHSGRCWDSVYLDPMYPEDGKTALPSKEMQFLRELTGGDWDTEALLTAALAAAPRVAVKRPTKAPWLTNRKPAMSLSSAQVRFDLYLSTTHIDRPASD